MRGSILIIIRRHWVRSNIKNNCSVLFVADRLRNQSHKWMLHVRCIGEIKKCNWRNFVFNLKDAKVWSLLRINKEYIRSIVYAIDWPFWKICIQEKGPQKPHNWLLVFFCGAFHLYGARCISCFSSENTLLTYYAGFQADFEDDVGVVIVEI